jgi:hypothetical protein
MTKAPPDTASLAHGEIHTRDLKTAITGLLQLTKVEL